MQRETGEVGPTGGLGSPCAFSGSEDSVWIDLAFEPVVFNTDQAIRALPPKEASAQDTIRRAFPQARVLQLNYPNILPSKGRAPPWCGGFRKDDLDFARRKVAKINTVIRDAVARPETGIGLVNLEQAFGDNPLCPGRTGALSNGIRKTYFRAEVRRLLNIGGNGDAIARSLLDTFVARYNDFKRCFIINALPFLTCNVVSAFNDVRTAADAVLDYLENRSPTIQANLIAPAASTSESENVRFDRSRGFFHPNGPGFSVLACNVRAVYLGQSAVPCVFDQASATAQTIAPPPDTVNGAEVGNAPVDLTDPMTLAVGGFEPGTAVSIVFSPGLEEIDTAIDDDGVVRKTLTLPSAGGGVHSVELEGVGADDVGVTKRVLVRYPGRPAGGDAYATYLCCFDPEPDELAPDYEDELVDIVYLGDVFTTLTPYEDGGLLVEVPMIDPLTRPGTVTIEARSRRTGKVITEVVTPIPSVAALWAMDTGPEALFVSGSGATSNGRVHSEGGIVLRGKGDNFTGGTEYVTAIDQGGGVGTIDPAPEQVSPGGSPLVRSIAEFRPGGPVATAAGENYTAVDPSACIDGVWRPDQSSLAGIVYVPCAVEISASGSSVGATIAAEGSVQVSGSRVTLTPSEAGMPALVSGAADEEAIAITGRNVEIRSSVFALAGGFHLTGSNGLLRCGAVARTIRVTGTRASVSLDESCLLPVSTE